MNGEATTHSSPQRILITGGAGFIGSHLAEALLLKGFRVTVIDDLSTGRFENIAGLTRQWATFRFAIDTITNASVLDRLVSECDIIVHLAAAVGVKLIVEHPVQTIETNVIGTEAVLKAALRYRVKVLVASTSEIYGKRTNTPFQEDDDVVLGPSSRNRWGYATSKLVDEFLALAYYHEKGLPVVIFRLFNTVGPRQTGQYGMVLPRFAEQALRGEQLTVYGDGQQSRCFLHVHDAITAIMALAEHPAAVGQVFNVGSTEEVTIVDVARRILAIADEIQAAASDRRPQDDRVTFIPYEQAYAAGFEDMRRRVPDLTRIHALTGWEPHYSLDALLRDIVGSVQRGD